MTSPPQPDPPTNCEHPLDTVKVALTAATGSWSAVCIGCGGRWLRIDKGIPPAVMNAVYACAGMVTISREEADALGFYVVGVGDPYLPPSPLKDGLRWIITPEEVHCGVYSPSPSEATVDAFHTERTEFALTSGDHALILGARFGRAIGWWDGSWQAVLQHGHFESGMSAPEPGVHLAVKLILVDSTTGLVAGMRIVTWPEHFHRAVYKAVRSQLDNRSSAEDGFQEIAVWQQRYPYPEDLVARRAEMTVRGGAETAFARREGEYR